jgi:regulatory protein
MGRVLAVEARPRSRLAEVRLDDGSILTFARDTVARLSIKPGATFTEAELRAARREDEQGRAVAAALRLLSLRARSRKDLQDRLRRRGFSAAATAAAVSRMSDLGYLDDAAFARGYVESRQAATPRSRRFLRYELGRSGVASDQVEAAVEAVSDDTAAYEAASRRLRALRGVDRETFRRRLGAFLTSRGFSYGVARAVIDRCWVELTEAAEGG